MCIILCTKTHTQKIRSNPRVGNNRFSEQKQSRSFTLHYFVIVVGPKRIVFVEDLVVRIRQWDQGFVSDREPGTSVTLQRLDNYETNVNSDKLLGVQKS